MRRSIRLLMMSAVVVGTLGAFIGGSALGAGAQTTAVDGSEQCMVLSPVPPVTAGPVTVTGTAPAGSSVQLFGPTGSKVGNPSTTGSDGKFTINADFPAPGGQFSVNYTLVDKDGYANGCVDPSATVVVKPASVTAPAAALAFTGSSNTTTYVLVGLAAIVFGTVLVVAARRRSHVNP